MMSASLILFGSIQQKEIQCLTFDLACGQLAVVRCHPGETNSYEVRGLVWPLPSPTQLTSFGQMPSGFCVTLQVCKSTTTQSTVARAYSKGPSTLSFTSKSNCLRSPWPGLIWSLDSCGKERVFGSICCFKKKGGGASVCWTRSHCWGLCSQTVWEFRAGTGRTSVVQFGLASRSSMWGMGDSCGPGYCKAADSHARHGVGSHTGHPWNCTLLPVYHNTHTWTHFLSKSWRNMPSKYYMTPSIKCVWEPVKAETTHMLVLIRQKGL